MVVAMVFVGVVQVAFDEVVHMISVRHRFVAAPGSVGLVLVVS